MPNSILLGTGVNHLLRPITCPACYIHAAPLLTGTLSLSFELSLSLEPFLDCLLAKPSNKAEFSQISILFCNMSSCCLNLDSRLNTFLLQLPQLLFEAGNVFPLTLPAAALVLPYAQSAVNVLTSGQSVLSPGKKGPANTLWGDMQCACQVTSRLDLLLTTTQVSLDEGAPKLQSTRALWSEGLAKTVTGCSCMIGRESRFLSPVRFHPC